MVALKAHQVEQFVDKPNQPYSVYLIYGPDRGLVSEMAGKLASELSDNLDDPFSTIKLDAQSSVDIAESLATEAYTVGMFADRRVVWVKSADNTKAFVDQISKIAADPPESTIILLEAGELKKSSALRKCCETNSSCVALPCYQDNAKQISWLIESVLAAAGKSIELDARNLLQQHLGGDRSASRSELEKLTLYAGQDKTITVDHVTASIGDISLSGADDVIDAVFGGDIGGFDRSFEKFIASGANPNLLFIIGTRQFQMLERLRNIMDENGLSAAAAVTQAKPPVFFARRAIVENALRRWTAQGLRHALMRLRDGVLAVRQTGSLDIPAARLCLLALTIQSARRR